MGLEDMVSIFSFLPIVKKSKKETWDAFHDIRNMFKDIIEKRMTEEECGESEDFIDDYMKAHKAMDETEVNTLLDLCQDLFVAGTETTSSTLNFAIAHLLNHPAWQEEVFLELSSVLQDRKPSMDDIQHLPKLQAIVQETLRLNPNAPLILHATAQQTRLRDFVIPANCLVLINVYHINYDPVTFPDPTSFQPGRWLTADGSFRHDLVFRVPTFGEGRRVCVGKALAKTEMLLFLASVLRHFSFAVPEGDKLPSGKLDGDQFLVAPEY